MHVRGCTIYIPAAVLFSYLSINMEASIKWATRHVCTLQDFSHTLPLWLWIYVCVVFCVVFSSSFLLWHAGALHSKQEMGWQRKSWYNVLASISYWTTGNHSWSIISGRMNARYVREPVAGIGRLSVHQRFLLGCCHRSELRSCVKVEAAVLDSPSLTVLMVSVDIKQHWTWTCQNEHASYYVFCLEPV